MSHLYTRNISDWQYLYCAYSNYPQTLLLVRIGVWSAISSDRTDTASRGSGLSGKGSRGGRGSVRGTKAPRRRGSRWTGRGLERGFVRQARGPANGGSAASGSFGGHIGQCGAPDLPGTGAFQPRWRIKATSLCGPGVRLAGSFGPVPPNPRRQGVCLRRTPLRRPPGRAPGASFYEQVLRDQARPSRSVQPSPRQDEPSVSFTLNSILILRSERLQASRTTNGARNPFRIWL